MQVANLSVLLKGTPLRARDATWAEVGVNYDSVVPEASAGPLELRWPFRIVLSQGGEVDPLYTGLDHAGCRLCPAKRCLLG